MCYFYIGVTRLERCWYHCFVEIYCRKTIFKICWSWIQTVIQINPKILDTFFFGLFQTVCNLLSYAAKIQTNTNDNINYISKILIKTIRIVSSSLFPSDFHDRFSHMRGKGWVWRGFFSWWQSAAPLLQQLSSSEGRHECGQTVTPCFITPVGFTLQWEISDSHCHSVSSLPGAISPKIPHSNTAHAATVCNSTQF